MHLTSLLPIFSTPFTSTYSDAKAIVVPRELSGTTSKSVLEQHAIASPVSVDIAAGEFTCTSFLVYTAWTSQRACVCVPNLHAL